jgi:hypothetical protein
MLGRFFLRQAKMSIFSMPRTGGKAWQTALASKTASQTAICVPHQQSGQQAEFNQISKMTQTKRRPFFDRQRLEATINTTAGAEKKRRGSGTDA